MAASLGALLFAAHPIHVDAVSWASASNELLFTTFILAALITLGKGAIEEKQSWIALSVGFYGGALLSKETAVAALPVFPLLWWIVQKDSGAKREILKGWGDLQVGALYLVPTGLYVITRGLVLGGTGIEAGKHGWGELVYSSPSFLIFYLRKLLWPTGLAGFYVNPLTSTPTLPMWLMAASLVLGACLLIGLSRRISSAILLGAALIFLPLLPLLAAIRVYDQGNMTHDRYLYLPSVGLCLLLGLAIDKASYDRRARLATVSMCAGIAVIFGIMTVRQQKFYQDDEVFYQRALTVDPRNSLVMGYLGDAYLEENQNELAMEWFERGLKTTPNDANSKFFFARGLMKTRQYSAAMPYLKDLAYRNEQMSLRRRSAILLSLANAQLQLNELELAEQTLQDLDKFNSTFPGLHRTLGIVFQRKGDIQQAQEEYALEFQVSGDREAGKQALVLARQLSGGHVSSQH
jgi:tetratricopeptide (TPR) repeat protein